MNDLKKIIDYIKNLPISGRILTLVAIVALLICAFFASCSSHRNFSVSVDKADKVNVNYTDSINATFPNF